MRVSLFLLVVCYIAGFLTLCAVKLLSSDGNLDSRTLLAYCSSRLMTLKSLVHQMFLCDNRPDLVLAFVAPPLTHLNYFELVDYALMIKFHGL